MFLGHYALGFGAKKLTPYTSLGTLLLGAEFVDLLWPTFLMLGVETVRIAPGITRVTPLDFTSYPWTHSLVMGAVWAGLFAALYTFFRRYPRGAMVLAALVLSHWLLDVISHRPDMPIWPGGGPTIGLGLWTPSADTASLRSSSPWPRSISRACSARRRRARRQSPWLARGSGFS